MQNKNRYGVEKLLIDVENYPDLLLLTRSRKTTPIFLLLTRSSRKTAQTFLLSGIFARAFAENPDSFTTW
jgi:hypothetical protein